MSNDIVYAEDIVMIGDIAERYGVSKAAAQGWMRRSDFPAPVVQLTAGAVYNDAEIRTWRKNRAAAYQKKAEELS